MTEDSETSAEAGTVEGVETTDADGVGREVSASDGGGGSPAGWQSPTADGDPTSGDDDSAVAQEAPVEKALGSVDGIVSPEVPVDAGAAAPWGGVAPGAYPPPYPGASLGAGPVGAPMYAAPYYPPPPPTLGGVAGPGFPPPPPGAGYPPAGGAQGGGAGGPWGPYGGYPGTGGPWPGYPAAGGHPRRPKSQSSLIGAAVGFGVAALLLGGVIGHATWPSSSVPASNGGSIQIPLGGGSSGGGSSSAAAGAPSNISGIAAKVTPGLVDINTNLSYEGESAAGTGMVLTAGGEILTNNHVIDGATSINVTVITTQKSYTAHVVGYDKSKDVAVLQLTGAGGLATITPNTSNASVGQAVVALGNAGGAGGKPSVAGGSITALNQSITASENGTGANSEALTGLIETNANIQPGDSGGALSNSSGQVIGMNTAAATSSVVGGVTDQAYAIPIGTALGLAKSIESGTAGSGIHLGTTAFIGVQVENNSTGGGVIAQVVSGSPASALGLVPGDTITAINGVTISAAGDISANLASKHAGDVVSVTWLDASGVSHTGSLTLASGPPA